MDMAVRTHLVWDEQYALGHSRIDAQHQHLFALYARVCEAFARCDGTEALRDAVMGLKAYTGYHFRTEEELMERLGYHGLEAHRAEHNKLMAQVETFAEELEDGKPVLTYEVLSFLREWIRQHILEEDMKLKPELARWQ